MGLFIFIKDREDVNPWTYNTRIHEYGHTWQCLLLGPLYYIVIALPSVIWCNFFAKYREKNNLPIPLFDANYKIDKRSSSVIKNK